VHAPEPLVDAAARKDGNDVGIAFWEEGGAPLAALGLDPAAPPSALWLVIGPEGGLSAAEIAALEALGYQRVGLGSAVLRVDTAAAVAVALLLDRCGRLRD
jgi:16S rRNA (uracil1498-N3)-methyltransferase